MCVSLKDTAAALCQIRAYSICGNSHAAAWRVFLTTASCGIIFGESREV